MSITFCGNENHLIVSGACDGTLISWDFYTGFIKDYLHELDATSYDLEGKK